jgi:hypothetical protein
MAVALVAPQDLVIERQALGATVIMLLHLQITHILNTVAVLQAVII